MYKTNGQHFQANVTNYVLYNASVPYLDVEHKPYFILAVIILTTFNIFPIILLFAYPTKTFQKLLGCFPRARWDYLHMFMDCFQGCYKNGTNNTPDYRYVSGFYLLLRLVYTNLGVIFSDFNIIFLELPILLMFVFLFGVLCPYRNDLYNKLDLGFLGLLILATLCVICDQYIKQLPGMIIYVVACVPTAYTLFLFLCGLVTMLCPGVIFKVKKKLGLQL